METIFDNGNANYIRSPIASCSLTIGGFDGYHLGHQKLFEKVKTNAAIHKRVAAAMFFDPLPRFYWDRDTSIANTSGISNSQTLSPVQEKITAMHSLGIGRVIAKRFDSSLAKMTAESFVAGTISKLYRCKFLVIGENFRFGAQREAGIDRLKALCDKYSIELEVSALEKDHADRTISSTNIRRYLKSGSIRDAAAMLGRPYGVLGRICSGEGLGKDMGFPTLNIRGIQQLIPPDGVYAGKVTNAATQLGRSLTSSSLPCVIAIGNRPSIGMNLKTSIEIHVLNGIESLSTNSGAYLKLEFIDRIRGIVKFDSIEALKSQIAKDITQAQYQLRSSCR